MIDNMESLVGLLYRADWTQLSMSAEVTELTDLSVYSQMMFDSAPARPWSWRHPAERGPDGPDPAGADEESLGQRQSRLLIAPGGRFRTESSRDGTPLVSTSDEDTSPSWAPRRSPCDELLCPAWLPSRFELSIYGSAVVDGRQALRITGRPRPFSRGRFGPMHAAAPVGGPGSRRRQRPPGDELLDHVDAVVDAELGILLRCERQYDGKTLSLSEFTGITMNPAEASDPHQFEHSADEVDPDSEDDRDNDETAGESSSSRARSQAAKAAAKAAADLGMSALAMAIKLAPYKSGGLSGQWQAAAQYEEWHPPDADRDEPDDPVSGHILALIYQAGLHGSQIDAEFCAWQSGDALLQAAQDAGDRAGIAGISKLATAMSERATDTRKRAKIGVAAADQYRIDYVEAVGPRRPVIIAADGEHRWRVYPDRIAVGKATPLPGDIAGLLDPAWLLEWHLTGGQQVRFDGRPAYLVRVREPDRPSPRNLPTDSPSEVVIDADLGLALRLTVDYGGRPARILELRDVTTRPPADPAEFRIEIPPGTPTVADTGRMLDEVDAPAAMKVAADLAGRAFAGAAAAHGFAEKFLRGKPGRHSGPQ